MILRAPRWSVCAIPVGLCLLTACGSASAGGGSATSTTEVQVYGGTAVVDGRPISSNGAGAVPGACDGAIRVGVAYTGTGAAALREMDPRNRVRIQPRVADGTLVELFVDAVPISICGDRVHPGPNGESLWMKPEGRNSEGHMLYVAVDPPGSSIELQCREWVRGVNGRLSPMPVGRPTRLRSGYASTDLMMPYFSLWCSR